MQYDEAGINEHRVEDWNELKTLVVPGKVTWIDVRGLADVDALQKLGAAFNLHPLTLEDVLNTTQRPKIEPFDDLLYIVGHMVYFEKTDTGDQFLCSEQVSIFLGEDFVITIQEESCQDVFEPVRERLRKARGYARRHKGDYLVYALIDAIVDHFFPVLEVICDGLEEVEEAIGNHPEKSQLRTLQEHKRLLLQLRRAAWPCREILNSLLRDNFALVQEPTKVFLRDCYDHAVQIIELVETYRELSCDLVELWMSGISMRTNDIMRVLTVISAIFIPLTFVAGVYGMNFNPDKSPFNMPELEWPFGYFACLALMATVAGSMMLFFKRKNWL